MTIPVNAHFQVALTPNLVGEECVSLQLDNGQTVRLTASEARNLATSLIHAVSRVEVKSSLRVGQNLWRRNEHVEPKLSLAR